MQKVLAILEDKVQWIAIGLGAVFVLYMTWAYVLTPPAQVELGGQTLGPSEVDPYTVDKVAKPLEAEITRPGSVNLTVPNPKAVFVDAMEWKSARPVELSSNIWDSKTRDVLLPATQLPPGTPGQPGAPVQPGGVGAIAGVIDHLPVIIAPTAAPAIENKFGRSVIIPPQANGQPAPAPAPGTPVVGGVEKGWVTQLFKINVADIDSAFKAAKVPAALANSTCFLQVEMERVEVDHAGKQIAGSAKIIPPIGVWRTAPPPPFPADNAGRAEQSAFLQWATANTPDILQPLFHTTDPNKGDQWAKPGEALAGADQIFNVQTYTGPMTAPPLTDAQLKAVQQYRRDKYKADQDAKKKAVTPRSSPGGGRTPGGFPGGFPGAGGGAMERSYAPAPPPRRPAPGGTVRPPQPPYRPLGSDGVMEGGFGEGGFDGGGFGGAASVQPGLPQPGTDYPAGDFDPADPKWRIKPVEMWAHDDTVEPGRIYQYRARYKIRNPVFGAPNAVPPDQAAWADQFALASEWSAWGSPLTMPELVNFFVQSSKSPNSNIVRFDVFRWIDGTYKQEVFAVGPGDQIGTTKGDVDFSTNWTVVDFRTDDRQSNDPQILLVNNTDGSIVVRSYRADQSDPLYKQLKSQVDAQKQLEQTAAGTGNGVPPAIR